MSEREPNLLGGMIKYRVVIEKPMVIEASSSETARLEALQALVESPDLLTPSLSDELMSEHVDREQIRREALEVLLPGYYLPGEPEGGNPFITSHIALARHVLALLAELEQADKRIEQLSGWYNAEDRKSRDLQARLAKVPALVEALRRIERNVHGAGAERYAASIAREALVAWESE